MKHSEQNVTRYLLGEMTESEQVSLEETYFSDPEFFEEVTKIESELVDNYVRGRLSPRVRELFEKSYLAHPERRERVKFAEALASRLEQIEATRASPDQARWNVPWWRQLLAPARGPRPARALSFAIVSLLLVIAGTWLFVEARRARRELAQAQAQVASHGQRERELQQQITEERSRADEMAAELESLRNRMASQTTPPSGPTVPAFVSFLIRVGSSRSTGAGQPETLVIPAGTPEARLQVSLEENNYPSYSAVLQAIGGEEIFSRHRLTPRTSRSGATLTLNVPAARFRTGDYVLTLRGTTERGDVEDVSKSLFRVEKR